MVTAAEAVSYKLMRSGRVVTMAERRIEMRSGCFLWPRIRVKNPRLSDKMRHLLYHLCATANDPELMLGSIRTRSPTMPFTVPNLRPALRVMCPATTADVLDDTKGRRVITPDSHNEGGTKSAGMRASLIGRGSPSAVGATQAGSM